MSIAESILPEYDQEMASTRKMLELVPVDKLDWAPHPKSMKLGSLATHIEGFPDWGLTTLKQDALDIGGEYTPYVITTIPALLEKFDKEVAATRELVSRTSDEEFGKTWTLTAGGATLFAMPKIAVWRGMVMNHMVHHRAQLGVYFRLLDIPLPGIYGPSGDEMAKSKP